VTAKVKLDPAFIERQRRRLVDLRNSLATVTADEQGDEDSVNEQSSGEAIEYEDDAQRLATLELDGNLIARNAKRLAQIDRALAKIAEGTYGRSDASTDAIPVERLEAVPEAIYTLAEQQALESPRPPRR
jgi:DnaK suppressor protein